MKFPWQRNLSWCPDQNERTIELEKEVARLTGFLAQERALQEELEASRRLLGAPLPAEWQFLPAKIFKVDQAYFIDQGKEAGVRIGQPLIWENVYLGKVIEVQEQVARVELVIEEGSKTPVKIVSEEETQAKGILSGKGSLQAELDRVLIQEVLKEDDLVVTAGDLEIPPDLAIGKIKKLIQIKSEVYQRAEVVLTLDPERLSIVFLITKI